ncbi:MAG TPA: HD domain-containing protein [Lentimicrobium sp.]|nr:HD domain-containing protein [Lentimicrobium sp.]
MNQIYPNQRKIVNDPVYGFVTIPGEFLFNLIEHPLFQRLRRIRQLGLTSFVYPGALHTRFHHALGSMHLMTEAIETLRLKGSEITEKEAEASMAAILLHDIGHGPFSHSLEHSIVTGMNHEDLSMIIMERLNEEFNGKLDLAIEIFSNTYHKKFLHQLVSSQLDMDRLDYLKRDSFYTGVSEGVINTDRLIKMLVVNNDELMVEAKGIYSIEKFIVARRLMYWQVYYHKTVVGAENILINLLRRAKYLANSGNKLFGTPSLLFFLENNFSKDDFIHNKELIDRFAQLDDYDIFSALKVWQVSDDKILSYLSSYLVDRKLFRTELRNEPFSSTDIRMLKKMIAEHFRIDDEETAYLFSHGSITNNAYIPEYDKINILNKDRTVVDISVSSDQLNVSLLTKTVTKHFLCYPKIINRLNTVN